MSAGLRLPPGATGTVGRAPEEVSTEAMASPETAGGPPLDELEHLRLTLEAAEVGIWQWDIATGRVDWSDNLEAIQKARNVA